MDSYFFPFNKSTNYFFTSDKRPVNIVGNYRGASIFFICNGPSLVNYDLSLMKQAGISTYGINNGPRTFRPDFWSCVDNPSRFMMNIWQDPKICKIVPSSHSNKVIFNNETWEDCYIDGRKKLVKDCPNTLYFERNSKFIAEKYLPENTINWGNDKQYGGGRSVMLAVLKIIYLLGFRNVYLIGADFNMSESYTYHFEEDRHRGAVKNNLKTYNRMETEYFPQLRPHFEKAGYHVFNCTKGSKLTAFPYLDFEEAIDKASRETGDPNSRTKGLYTKGKEKEAKKDDSKVKGINNRKVNKFKSINNVASNPYHLSQKPKKENLIKKDGEEFNSSFIIKNKNIKGQIKSVDNSCTKPYVKSMEIKSKSDLEKFFKKSK